MIFEPNCKDDKIEQKGKSFDCYDNGLLVGRIEIYKNHYLENKQEVYIEVFKEFRSQGYSKLIYDSFIDKATKLGFKNLHFYCVVKNNNKISLKLHNKLVEEHYAFSFFSKDDIATIYTFEVNNWTI
jgi:GNAT superfamily N-acetyltransferase